MSPGVVIGLGVCGSWPVSRSAPAPGLMMIGLIATGVCPASASVPAPGATVLPAASAMRTATRATSLAPMPPSFVIVTPVVPVAWPTSMPSALALSMASWVGVAADQLPALLPAMLNVPSLAVRFVGVSVSGVVAAVEVAASPLGWGVV